MINIKTVKSVVSIVGALCCSIPIASAGKNKVIICHMTSEGSEKFHTIEVNPSALNAHLGHGDLVGDCCEHCEVLCDDQGSCEGCSVCPGWSTCQASEPCCDPQTHQFLASGTVCDTFEEFQCTDTTCGADVQRRLVTRQCNGDSGSCPEEMLYSPWTTIDCGPDQVCQTDFLTYAECTTCPHGCGAPGCYPECNPSQAAVCCSTGGNIYTGCLHLTKAGNGLDWQNPHNAASLNFFAATDYCASLALGGHTNWRMPTIGELRSLVLGCSNTESTGACPVGDGCDASSCHVSAYCTSCIAAQAPNGGNCFWSDAIEASSCGTFWSASSLSDDDTQAWLVNFTTGDITSFLKEFEYQVRCVRTVE